MSDDWRFAQYNDAIGGQEQETCPTCGKRLDAPELGEEMEKYITIRMQEIVEDLNLHACDDPTNFRIKMRRLRGDSMRMIAEELGFKSHVSVHKRIKTMKELESHMMVNSGGHSLLERAVLARGLKHEQVAKLMGCTRSAVSKACRRGIRNSATALRYAEALGCSVWEIMEE